MSQIIKLSSALFLFLWASFQMTAQCDSIAQVCSQNIPEGFISDGQSYRAFLVDEETAEFRTTFFEGTDYRIAACSGFEPTNMIFRIMDQKRNILFTNEDYDLISYWNFRSENTTECIVEAQLNNEAVDSGCAVILVAFSR
ncbi:MAG: hypothetical protein HKN45_03445 [Flavobacteriales bacterium]|nr:hypothetical protein [Flavobacteriales bacterium]NNK81300.1 hypothetical protein [Flavobacteriales bacterium]